MQQASAYLAPLYMPRHNAEFAVPTAEPGSVFVSYRQQLSGHFVRTPRARRGQRQLRDVRAAQIAEPGRAHTGSLRQAASAGASLSESIALYRRKTHCLIGYKICRRSLGTFGNTSPTQIEVAYDKQLAGAAIEERPKQNSFRIFGTIRNTTFGVLTHGIRSKLCIQQHSRSAIRYRESSQPSCGSYAAPLAVSTRTGARQRAAPPGGRSFNPRCDE
ncbi:hypothetical protein SAMN04487768_1117 [Burkholderia sp. b13]|nr:hypothetical protein SAMN04487768_1117 [Burkholderia sp. b13]